MNELLLEKQKLCAFPVMNTMCIQYTHDCFLRDISVAICKIIQYDFTELREKKWEKSFFDKELHFLHDYLRTCMKFHRRIHEPFQFRMMKKSSTSRKKEFAWFEIISVEIVYDVLDSVQGIVCHVQDITDTKASEECSLTIDIPIQKSPYEGIFTGKTAFFVEDTDTCKIVQEKFLKVTGVNIIHSAHGQEALKIFAEQHALFDIVLLDIKLPGLNGFQLLTEFKAINPHIPVIAVTAYAMEEERKAIQEAGFDGYHSKPVFQDSLIKMMSSFLLKEKW